MKRIEKSSKCNHKKVTTIFDLYTQRKSDKKRRWEGNGVQCFKCGRFFMQKAKKKYKWIDEKLSEQGIHL